MFAIDSILTKEDLTDYCEQELSKAKTNLEMMIDNSKGKPGKDLLFDDIVGCLNAIDICVGNINMEGM